MHIPMGMLGCVNTEYTRSSGFRSHQLMFFFQHGGVPTIQRGKGGTGGPRWKHILTTMNHRLTID